MATTAIIPAVDVSTIDYIEQNSGTNITLTASLTAKYLFVFYYNSSYDTITQQEILDTIQVEEGLVATPYVPYNSIGIKIQNKNLGKDNFNSKIYISGSGDNRKVEERTSTVGEIIKVKPNTAYKISGDFSNLGDSALRVALFNNFPQIGDAPTEVRYSTGTLSFTTTSSTNYFLLYNTFNRATVVPNLFVRETSSGDDYVEHQEQTKYFTFEDGQYLAEGDYLADDGIHNVMGQIILDGSEDESWSISNTGTDNFYYRYRYLTDRVAVASSSTEDYCDRFVNISISSSNTYTGFYILETNELRVRFGTEMTIANFKTWLSNNPITVQYELATPTVIPYTPTQQAQWNAIKTMKTYKNVSHISTEGGTLDPSLDVVYYKDLETLFANLA